MQKNKNIVITIIVLIILIISYCNGKDSSSVNSLYTINTTTYVATSKDNFEIMSKALMRNDTRLLNDLMSNGYVFLRYAGEEVYLVKASFTYSIINIKGSSEKFWVINEYITKK